MKPLIKWAGGKTQLLTHIKPMIPNRYNNYFEPFIGGGAVFLNQEPARAYIGDMNKTLIGFYNHAKDSPDQLISILLKLTAEPITSDRYYQYREWYNSENKPSIDKCALFYILNKTGFNGLYRENKSGGFNVPYGRRDCPKIDTSHFYQLSEVLKTAVITAGDFEQHAELIKAGDFVYLDPPYHKTFTSYTGGGFNDDSQKRLKMYCDTVNSKGAKFLLSNSNTKFINDLYEGYNITEITARKNINRNGSGRSGQKEVLISNYEN